MRKSSAEIFRLFLIVGMAISFLIISPLSTKGALAYDETSTSAINIDSEGVALRGYDPVAYFTDGRPTKGSEQFQATYDGGRYLFSSAANRGAFLKQPEKFAPAFGGFCAMGAVFGKKLDGDPNFWRIVDGKLYLNVGDHAAKRWVEDVPGNIAKANENWPAIKDKKPNGL